MKKILNMLPLVFLVLGLQAKENPNTFADYTYTIHIGAFVKANISDFKSIQPFGYIYSQRFNNLQQVYMGDYASEAAADKILAKVKNAGFMDAFTTRRSLKKGNSITAIQLATVSVGDQIDWQEYADAGPLSVLLVGKSVKIIAGSFDDMQLAKQRLSILKKIGYKDAFLKNVNELLLHKVTTFETGGKAIIPEEFSYIEAPKEIVRVESPLTKAETFTAKSPEKVDIVPESYDVVLMPKSVSAKNTIAQPSIRKNVKRTSVLKLQEVLKAEGTYKSSLDGFYGLGTAKGYDLTMANNPEIQKYKALSTLAKNSDSAENPLNWGPIILLETIVNDINPNPGKSDAEEATKRHEKQTRLLATKKAPNATEYAYIDNWNTTLWKGITKWEQADPLHIRMTTPFKIAYFKSWALLEDYYMDKGFKAKEARGLSLYVLQNIVESRLKSYKK